MKEEHREIQRRCVRIFCETRNLNHANENVRLRCMKLGYLISNIRKWRKVFIAYYLESSNVSNMRCAFVESSFDGSQFYLLMYKFDIEDSPKFVPRALIAIKRTTAETIIFKRPVSMYKEDPQIWYSMETMIFMFNLRKPEASNPISYIDATIRRNAVTEQLVKTEYFGLYYFHNLEYEILVGNIDSTKIFLLFYEKHSENQELMLFRMLIPITEKHLETWHQRALEP